MNSSNVGVSLYLLLHVQYILFFWSTSDSEQNQIVVCQFFGMNVKKKRKSWTHTINQLMLTDLCHAWILNFNFSDFRDVFPHQISTVITDHHSGLWCNILHIYIVNCMSGIRKAKEWFKSLCNISSSRRKMKPKWKWIGHYILCCAKATAHPHFISMQKCWTRGSGITCLMGIPRSRVK